MKASKIAAALFGFFLCLGVESLGRDGLGHHRDRQDTVCFIHTDWDPPLDSRCIKEGENSSGIPVFLCCGPS